MENTTPTPKKNTWKAIWDMLTKNPVAFIKWLLQSADHSEGGASQKKVLGYYFGGLIGGFDFAYYWYQLRLGHFENFTLVWVLHASVLGTLIGINFAFEKFLKTNDKAE